ncbi:MAG: thioredoxin family protein [Bacteroidia bacterium]|nr:thioredoxin family protein [Bacteroidia bacterium]
MEGLELLYFQARGCGVCHALRPKLEALLQSDYPNLQLTIIDISEDREAAAQHVVFTTPVLIIKVDGREYERFVRAFSVHQVNEKLEKIVNAFNEA